MTGEGEAGVLGTRGPFTTPPATKTSAWSVSTSTARAMIWKKELFTGAAGAVAGRGLSALMPTAISTATRSAPLDPLAVQSSDCVAKTACKPVAAAPVHAKADREARTSMERGRERIEF